MNRTTIASAVVIAWALGAGIAHAQTALTREQVKAQYAQAVRDGDVAPAGEGMTLRQRDPARYPGALPPSTTTRAQVRAEYGEALRAGDVMAAGETGLKLNELHPERFPATVLAGSAKTREQVKLELAEAIRQGDIVEGESGLKRNELHPQRYAAARGARMLAQRSADAASAAAH